MKAETIKNTVSHSTFQDFRKKGLRHWVEQKEKTMVSENDKALKIVTIWLVFVYKLMIKKWYFIFSASSKIRDGARLRRLSFQNRVSSEDSSESPMFSSC